jgi:hypothetical protein
MFYDNFPAVLLSACGKQKEEKLSVQSVGQSPLHL